MSFQQGICTTSRKVFLKLFLCFSENRSFLIINIQKFLFYFCCFSAQLLVSDPSLIINILLILVHGVKVVHTVRVVGVHGESPRRLCQQSLEEADWRWLDRREEDDKITLNGYCCPRKESLRSTSSEQSEQFSLLQSFRLDCKNEINPQSLQIFLFWTYQMG